MYQAKIIVRYVNQPRSDRAYSGSIKDEQGTAYSVPKEQLWRFQPNGTYDITFQPKQGNDGRQYNDVVSVNGDPIGGRQPGPSQAGQHVPPQYAPQREQSQAPQPVALSLPAPLPPPFTPPPPPPMQHHPTSVAPPPTPVQQPTTARDDTLARDIFVTGVVGRSMGSGKFEADAIGRLTHAADAAWRALTDGLLRPVAHQPQPGPIGPEPPPLPDSVARDEIPFDDLTP